MNSWILKILRCPLCLGSLTPQASTEASAEAALSCTDCGRVYPITEGVPRMAITSGASGEIARSFGFQWRVREKKWFECSTLYGLSAKEERRDFFDRLGISPEDLTGKTILDAGCGDGFLLRILGEYSTEVVGIDINSSIEIPYRRCRDFSNVAVIQADILAPPFFPETFDYVWCEGALVYAEDPRKAFGMLSDLVKPGGRLYVWVYPAERLSVYQRARDLLRIAHRAPYPLLLALCYALAVPVALAQRLLPRRFRTESIRSIAFAFFDNLSPRIQTRHAVTEVRGWFKEFGFSEVKQTGMIAMSATKVR